MGQRVRGDAARALPRALKRLVDVAPLHREPRALRGEAAGAAAGRSAHAALLLDRGDRAALLPHDARRLRARLFEPRRGRGEGNPESGEPLRPLEAAESAPALEADVDSEPAPVPLPHRVQ